jgi:hypothetical protein
MHSTNYFDTFIAVAPDSGAVRGSEPPAPKRDPAKASVAWRAFQLIHGHPYRYTSDDVIFTVYADRRGIPAAARGKAREAFYAKPQACMRGSDLAKRYGWGITPTPRGASRSTVSRPRTTTPSSAASEGRPKAGR